jgi:membrane protease YdiL (CAAX protease family)
VGEISLATLVIDLVVKITRTGGPQRFSEIREIPWMKGLEQLPASAVPVAAALGGMVEELVFRGVVMGIMTSHSVAPAIAIAVAGILFVGQQLLQVRTPFQALVIGCGSAAISLVGGSLVVVTGSVLPAMVAHGSFVLFFMSAGRTQSRKDYLSRAGTVAP